MLFRCSTLYAFRCPHTRHTCFHKTENAQKACAASHNLILISQFLPLLINCEIHMIEGIFIKHSSVFQESALVLHIGICIVRVPVIKDRELYNRSPPAQSKQ